MTSDMCRNGTMVSLSDMCGHGSYGLSINLTEVIWKKMVKEAHPNKKEYQVDLLLYLFIICVCIYINFC